MKLALAFFLAIASVAWGSFAAGLAMRQPPVVITKKVFLQPQQANFIMPVQECCGNCKARARAALIFKQEGK